MFPGALSLVFGMFFARATPGPCFVTYFAYNPREACQSNKDNTAMLFLEFEVVN